MQNTETATRTTVQLLRLYREYDVELLIEAPGLRTENDLEIWRRLQSLCDELGATSTARKRQKVNTNGFVDGTLYGRSTKEPDKPKISPMDNVTDNRPEQPQRTVSSSLKKPGNAIVLFGTHDIRVKSNFALDAAMRQYEHIQPVFLWQPNQPEWGVCGALQVILKDAIRNLQTKLSGYSRLKLLCRNTDDAEVELFCITQEIQASAVFWNRAMTPDGAAAEKQREQALRSLDRSIQIESFQSFLLYDISRVDLVSGFQGGHWGTLMPF